MIRLSAFLTLLPALLPSSTQAAEVVKILGKGTIKIPVRESTTIEPHVAFKPVEILVGDEIVEFSTVEIARGGESLERDVVTCEIEGTELKVTIDCVRLARPGTYTVTVRAVAGEASSVLTLSIERPAAKLRSPAAVKVERIVRVPFLWHVYVPNKVVMDVSSMDAGMSINVQQWSTQLSESSGRIKGQVQFEFSPQDVSGGSQVEASIVSDSGIPLGQSTGQLIVRSDQLESGEVIIPIEMHSRVSWFWLMVTIGAAIYYGYQVRIRDSDKIARNRVKISAEMMRRSLQQYRESGGDVSKDQIMELEEELAAVIRNPLATPDEIETAVNAAKEKLQELRDAADAKRQQLEERLKQWRLVVAKCQVGEPVALITERIGEAIQQHLDAGKAMGSGAVGEFLDNHEFVWLEELKGALTKWFGDAQDIIRELAEKETRAALAADLDARLQVEKAKLPADDVEQMLSIVKGASQLQLFLDDSHARIRSYEDVDSPSFGGPSFDEPRSGDDWLINVEGPRRCTLNQPLEWRLLVEANAPSGALDVSWTVQGPSHVPTTTGKNLTVFQMSPQNVGTYWIRVEAVDQAGERRSMDVRIDVEEAEGSVNIDSLYSEMKKRELRQTLVSAILIVGGGFLTFQASFAGTISDFFLAAAWGFTADIGISKVRETTSPLLKQRGIANAAPARASQTQPR